MYRKHLVTAALLIASATSLRAQTVKAGIEAWQRQDYTAAVAIWRPLAEKGDPDAEFNLGQAYRLGRGVQTNLAAAQTWFERAANEGHVDAQTTLGLLLFQNNDQAEGLKWLKKAADHGEPRALLVYGTALVNGDGITRDPALGYAYVSRAAAQGLEPAKETLAQLDTIIPLRDRKRASALERRLGKAMPASSATPAKSTQKTIETASANAPGPSALESPKRARAPATIRAKAAEAAVSPGGAWRIQLGAFSQKGAAEALYQKLRVKPELAGREAYYIPVGSITRLQVGPFETKSAAQAACKSATVACFPVASK